MDSVTENVLCIVSVASTWIRIGSSASTVAAPATMKVAAQHSIEKRRTADFNRLSSVTFVFRATICWLPVRLFWSASKMYGTLQHKPEQAGHCKAIADTVAAALATGVTPGGWR